MREDGRGDGGTESAVNVLTRTAASSFSLFSSNSQTLSPSSSPPLLSLTGLLFSRRILAVGSRVAAKNSRGISSSSPAVAAPDTSIQTEEGVSREKPEEEERVVLPTNDSSEKLLRIHHTDDAHIFCLDDQIKDEIRGVLNLTEEILLRFGFRKYEVNLSTRPEKSVGSDDIWEKATTALRDALDDKGWDYQIDEGGDAFYGPKIDLKIEETLGRKWQCLTVQADFKFESTLKIQLTQYEGEVVWRLRSSGIRAELCHGDCLPKLIRNAEKQKVPLMAVIGPKEVETQTVSVRSRFNGEIGNMTSDAFIGKIQLLVEYRTPL